MPHDPFGPATRRHFLAAQGLSLGSLALAWLLHQDGLRAAEDNTGPRQPLLERPVYDLKPKAPPAPPKAKAMITLFMQGGPSHHDLFDPKPELDRLDGKTFTGEIKYDNAGQASSKLLASPWKFHKRGQCGMELSELLPGLAEVADDITLIRSMHTGVNNHGQSINALNNGRIASGRPALGSWLTYGLGTENQNLPAYCVLSDPGGVPVLGVENWSSGWLPPLYQGTVIRPREPRILNLDPPPHLEGAPSAATSTTSTSSTASTSPPAPASRISPPGSPATNSPPGCRPRPRKPSTSPGSLPRPTNSTASTTPPAASSARGA